MESTKFTFSEHTLYSIFQIHYGCKSFWWKWRSLASKPISVEKCREIIINDINRGYDDITTDFIGWVLMACDMGLNKNWNYSKFWFLQLILGVVANLFIIPVYMIILKYDINNFFKKHSKLTDKDKAQWLNFCYEYILKQSWKKVYVCI